MREKLLMDKGWLFYFGEPTFKTPKYATTFDPVYRTTRAENARGPARRDFDDSGWRTVQLPHDFVVENGQSPTNPCAFHDGFPVDRGAGWYRRYFPLDEADRDKRITLLFDGVGTKCEVYVNSMLMKTHRTAGIGFEVDLTEVARFGPDYNVVSVHTDCHDYEGWYYEPGGLYRDVWLCKTSTLAVDLWGTYVRSRLADGQKKLWNIEASIEIRNSSCADMKGYVVNELFNDAGDLLAAEKGEPEKFMRLSVATIRQSLSVVDPALWAPKDMTTSVKSCTMHKLVTHVFSEGREVDTYTTDFGIRQVDFDSDKGIFINGRSIKVYGFANHQFYMGVGGAMSNSMREFQIRRLAEMGSNGFRTAHAPHAEAIYEYCDKYGLLVMDENRMYQPSDTAVDEVIRYVKRDRNHPSVIIYSLHNEEDTVCLETGRRIFQKLAAETKRLHPEAATSGAVSIGLFTPGALDDYDVIGVNHQTQYMTALRRLHPNKLLYGSEMCSPIGLPPFGRTDTRPGEDALQMRKDYVIGGFHFTGWDVNPIEGVTLSPINSCGAPEDTYYGFEVFFKQDIPLAKIASSWDYPDKEGEKVSITVPNNGDYVELFVNGKFETRAQTKLYSATPVTVQYKPGEIKAVAYKNGQVWATDIVCTPQKPAAIKLVMENVALMADDRDVAIISAYLIDSSGNVVRRACGPLCTFSCNEGGQFISGSSVRNDDFQGMSDGVIPFGNGQCQAYFRSLNTPGDLVITVKAPGFSDASLVIEREHKTPLKRVPTVPAHYILGWKISKLYTGKMDKEQIISRHTTESWETIDNVYGAPEDIMFGCFANPFTQTPAIYPPGTDFGFVYYAASTVPDMENSESECCGLFFEGVDGIVEIVVKSGNQSFYAQRSVDSPWPGHYRPEIIVPCPGLEAGAHVEIWIFIHKAQLVSGLDWPVRWTCTTPEEAARHWEGIREQWTLCQFRDSADIELE